MNCIEKKELDDGNCGEARIREQEAYFNDMSYEQKQSKRPTVEAICNAHSSVQEVKLEVAWELRSVMAPDTRLSSFLSCNPLCMFS